MIKCRKLLINVILIFAVICFLFGCKENKDAIAEEKDIQINCSYTLTEEDADKIASEIIQIMTQSKQGIYKMKNFKFEFMDDTTTNQGNSWIVKVDSEWILIREPEDSPVIKGMVEAKEKLQSIEQKEKAQEIINGYLAEMSPLLNESEKMEWTLKIVRTSNDKFDILYCLRKDEKENWIKLRDYCNKYWREDEKEKRKLGIHTIENALTENTTNP